MLSRRERMLHALTAPTAPAALVEAAGTHALRHEDLHRFAVELVTHPQLDNVAAQHLVDRISDRDAKLGRLAAAAYLTRSTHTAQDVTELLRRERRLTTLRHAAVRATSPEPLLNRLARHADPGVVLNVARNPHAHPTDRITAALSVDAAESAGRAVIGSCAMVDELPTETLEMFAAQATSSTLLLRLLGLPAAGAALTAGTAGRVADLVLRRQLRPTVTHQPTQRERLVAATLTLAACGDPQLRARMLRWWGEARDVPAADAARLRLALCGPPSRWGRWSWAAAATIARDQPDQAAALVADCARQVRTAEQWATLLEFQESFTGTVDQLVTVALGVSGGPGCDAAW